ncbi:MAG: M48 family metalloprotease, partial [Candidatus Eremiobacterota bacterium]
TQVPFLVVVRALGFQERRSPGLGFVDLVAPNTVDTGGGPSRAGDSLRRADYRVAADRMEMILGSLPEYRHPEMMRRVTTVGNRVAAATPLSNLHWKFVVLDHETPNAACTGEGHVFVTRGLFDLELTDDELAGVLGHEMAHGVRRHCFRVVELFRQYHLILRDMEVLKAKAAAYERGESTLVSESSLENEAKAIEQRMNSLVDRIKNERVYGRQDEEEADVLGMRYAIQAGYSPSGLTNALKKLEIYQQTFGEAVLEDDMTHPPIKRRLEILRRVQANY